MHIRLDQEILSSQWKNQTDVHCYYNCLLAELNFLLERLKFTSVLTWKKKIIQLLNEIKLGKKQKFQ